MNGEFIDSFLEYASDLEAPTDFNQWSGIICAASVLSRKVWIPSGYDGVHPCLYVFFVGPIGIGKDQAARLGADRLIKPVYADCLGVEIATKARFYQLLHHKSTTITLEGEEGDSLFTYSPATIFSSELESLTSADDEFFHALIELWSKRDFTYETVAHSKLFIERPAINFIGNTNPTSFAKFMRSGHISQGMGRRFITVYCTKRAQIRTFLQDYDAPHKVAQCNKLIFKLIAMYRYKGPYSWTPEYEYLVEQDNLKNVTKAQEGEFENEHFRAYFTDRKIFIWKLSMIFSACRNVADVDDPVSLERHKEKRVLEAEDFYRADELLKKSEASLRQLYKIASLNPDLEHETKIISWLKRGPLPREDIVIRMGKELDIMATERILASLSRKGQVMLNEGIVKLTMEDEDE